MEWSYRIVGNEALEVATSVLLRNMAWKRGVEVLVCQIDSKAKEWQTGAASLAERSGELDDSICRAWTGYLGQVRLPKCGNCAMGMKGSKTGMKTTEVEMKSHVVLSMEVVDGNGQCRQYRVRAGKPDVSAFWYYRWCTGREACNRSGMPYGSTAITA